MNQYDFLLEIGCDELPARFLQRLSQDLGATLRHEFEAIKLSFKKIECFATPRRIAVLVSQLDAKQGEQETNRQGPFIKDAYDKTGTPTLACIGFARSCGVSVDQLQRENTPKGERVCFSVKEPGLPTADILEPLVTKALKKLPLPKPMRWGTQDFSFLRPVQWIIILFGKKLIQAEFFGKKTTNLTRGHRFHHPEPLSITEPAAYADLLKEAYVIADFSERRQLIEKQIIAAAAPDTVIISPELLDEVTGLVEWPVALKGRYHADFLKLPREVLITSMKTHQKCFAVESQGQLKPYFILVSHIQSRHPEHVIKGNERVIHARLSDAKFFYENDCSVKLESRLSALDQVLYHEKLGSMGDRVKRITVIAAEISRLLGADVTVTTRGATLAKCDLLSEMVYEFPNLQGIMGYYYAQKEGEQEPVAVIIKDHYLPKFSGDVLPSTLEAAAVALADRIDTLVGIMGIDQKPSGDKDPFALRRAAQGVFRILIEKKLNLNLMTIIQKAATLFGNKLTNTMVESEVYAFIIERMKYAYIEQGFASNRFEAVLATETPCLFDFEQRLRAVESFCKLPEAAALAAANKRVSNLLKKQNLFDLPKKVNPSYFEMPAEETVYRLLQEQQEKVTQYTQTQHYTEALATLACFKEPIDQFFDTVMVMDNDTKKRMNRLALLNQLHALFTKVADISLISETESSVPVPE